MRIELRKNRSLPMYQQIVAQIRQQIQSGELPPGYRLPPERRLATELGVNRTTILSAYRELKAENLIGSRVGQGTVVLPRSNGEGTHSDLLAKDSGQSNPAPEPLWPQFYSAYANRLDNSAMSTVLDIINQEPVISFATGTASPTHMPREVLDEVEKELLAPGKDLAEISSPVEGLSSLRKAIAVYLEQNACPCDPKEVMVLSGSQQGIDLVAKVFLDPGDVVIVEEPSFFSATQVFRAAGARIMGVPMDQEGMQLEVLEELLQRHHPKLIYTIPNFHNPTGVELSLARRKGLIELAQRYKVFILEDDAYGALRYSGVPLPSLKSLDRSGYVIYLNTFSKVLHPGLRIGWVVAHPELLRRFTAIRQIIDLHTTILAQNLVDKLLNSGKFAAHLALIRQDYADRRDRMLAALHKQALPGLTWYTPQGGFYIWVKLPEGITGTQLLAEVAEKNLLFMPGNFFFIDRQNDRYARLNFTYPAKKDISSGIAIFCAGIRALNREKVETEPRTLFETTPIL